MDFEKKLDNSKGSNSFDYSRFAVIRPTDGEVHQERLWIVIPQVSRKIINISISSVVLGLLSSTLVFVTGIEHASLRYEDAAELSYMAIAKNIPVFDLTDNIENIFAGLNDVEVFLTGSDLSLGDLICVKTWEYNRMVAPYTLSAIIHPSRGSRGSNEYTNGKIDIKRGCFSEVREFDINSYWGVPIESLHSHFFHANPGSLLQMRGLELPVSNESKENGNTGKEKIRCDVPERELVVKRRFG